MGVDVRAFEALLQKQHSVISRGQALSVGLSEHAIRHRIAQGRWQKLLAGTYLVHGFPPSHEQWCTAALLFCGAQARIWGQSAARLHLLWGFTPRPDQLDLPMLPVVVGVPHSQQVAANEHLKVIRCRDFEAADFAVRNGFPTSSIVATLIHLAADASQPQLAMAYGDVHRRGHYAWLRKRFEEVRRGREGLHRLHELISQVDSQVGAVKSPLEAWCADVMRRGGLTPVRQWPIQYQRKRCIFDFAFPELKLAIETDGRKVHAADPFFNNDRVRWNWIENRGWSHLKFTWRQMYDERYVVETIRERIALLRGGAVQRA